MRRLNRHIALAGLSLILVGAIYGLLAPGGTLYRLSMATAYTGLILIAITLSIGPVNLLRNGRNPVSSYLRRDIGIWAGIVSIAHVIFGLQRHLGGRFWLYFLDRPRSGQGLSIRMDAFGVSNHAGLVATLLIAILLACSNDLSIGRLGIARWKAIQRLNYLLLPLIAGHGVIYQALGDRLLPFSIVIAALSLFVFGIQLQGYRSYRQG